MADKPNILTIDATSKRVPRLGEREAWRPTYDVGGKLAVKNVHAIGIELRRALKAGYKKRELLVWRGIDGMARLFLVAGFVAKYQLTEPDICGDVLDRYKWLQDNAYDRDMIYVNILDPATRKYEVGMLDQPKRVTHSVSMERTTRRERREAARRS